MAATELSRGAVVAVLAAVQALLPATASVAEGGGSHFSFRIHDYDEAPFDGAHDGAVQRYHVQTEQARLQLELRGGFELAATGTVETMSGSSPWFVVPDASGQPFQVLSGSSIADSRRELAVSLATSATENTQHRVSAQHSDEDDFHGSAAGYQFEYNLDAQRRIATGLSLGFDRIAPSDASLYGRIAHAQKHSQSVFLALTTVLDRDRLLQAGLAYERHSGYLSDPYKRVLVGVNVVPDARPDLRQQWSALLRYRQALLAGAAAWHGDYRYSHDSWGIRAHEVEFSWHQDLGRHFEWAPSLRYYSQTAAGFYAPFFRAARDDAHASSDYRLGRFGAFGVGLSLRRQWSDFALVFSAERYRSATGYALGGAGAAVPALVEFDRLSLGCDWQF